MKKCSKGYKKENGKCVYKKTYQNPPIYNFGGVHLGTGFLGLLTVLFIGLKLAHIIDWSWFLVLSPLWIPAAFVFLFYLIFIIIMRIFK